MHEDDILQWIKEGNFQNWIPEENTGPYARFYRVKFNRLMGHSTEDLKHTLRELYREVQENTFLQSEILLELAYLEWLTGENYKRTIKILENLGKNYKSIASKISFLEGVIALRSGDKKQAMEKFIFCVTEDSEELIRARALNNIAGIQMLVGDYKNAEENFKKCISMFRNLHNPSLTTSAIENLANTKKQLGKLDEALKLYKEANMYREEQRMMRELAQNLHNIAVIMQRMGDYNNAITKYIESIKIREGLDLQLETSWTYLNLGNLYLEMGEINKAVENVEKSLVIRKQLGSLAEVAQSLQGMGRIHLRINNISEGRGYLMESLNIFLEENDYLWTSSTLFYLITSYVDEGEYGRAKDFFGVHHELVKDSNISQITQRHRLLEGILQTAKERAVEKFQAIEIFEEIVHSETYEFRIRSIAMVELADLYILELRLGKNNELISLLENLLSKMLEFSLESQSYPIYIKFLMVKARLNLVKLRAGDSLQLLQEALVLCEEKGLVQFHNEVKNEIKKMEELLINVWDKMIGPNTSLIERLKVASLVDYMNDVSHILKNFQ